MQTADLQVTEVNIVVKSSTRFPFHKTNPLEDLGKGNLLEHFTTMFTSLPASLQVCNPHLSHTDEFVGPTNTEPFGLQITSSHFRMNFKQCTLFECQCIKPEITNILRTLFLHLLLEKGLPFYLVIQAMQRTGCLQSKGSTFNVQSF